jgi:hypothetical protein
MILFLLFILLINLLFGLFTDDQPPEQSHSEIDEGKTAQPGLTDTEQSDSYN